MSPQFYIVSVLRAGHLPCGAHSARGDARLAQPTARVSRPVRDARGGQEDPDAVPHRTIHRRRGATAITTTTCSRIVLLMTNECSS